MLGAKRGDFPSLTVNQITCRAAKACKSPGGHWGWIAYERQFQGGRVFVPGLVSNKKQIRLKWVETLFKKIIAVGEWDYCSREVLSVLKVR